jgi:putative peptidoglycan lipid II flippase
VVSWFAIGLPAYSLIYVLFRAWYALENTRTPFWFAVLINVANLSVAYPLFMDATVDQKINTLAIGYSAAYTLAVVVAWMRLRQQLPLLDTRRTLFTLLKVGAAAIAAGAVATMALPASLFGSGPLGDLGSVMAIWLVGGVGFVGLSVLLRVSEVTDAITLVRRKLGR